MPRQPTHTSPTRTHAPRPHAPMPCTHPPRGWRSSGNRKKPMRYRLSTHVRWRQYHSYREEAELQVGAGQALGHASAQRCRRGRPGRGSAQAQGRPHRRQGRDEPGAARVRNGCHPLPPLAGRQVAPRHQGEHLRAAVLQQARQGSQGRAEGHADRARRPRGPKRTPHRSWLGCEERLRGTDDSRRTG